MKTAGRGTEGAAGEASNDAKRPIRPADVTTSRELAAFGESDQKVIT